MSFQNQSAFDATPPPAPTALPSDTLYQPGDVIGPGYHVQKVKKGGMGEVYLCYSKMGDQLLPSALKTFQSQFAFDPDIRKEFEHELATWVALGDHPNIVQCSGIVEDPSRPFMDLYWVQPGKGKGFDLQEWLDDGPLDLRTALAFLIGVCDGMIHANQKIPGIVHRDLKPGNILVEHGKIPRITDFGLVAIVQQARMTINPSTSPSTSGGSDRQSLIGAEGVVGTRPYMAPEQLRADPIDTRTDIYAVGAILYTLLVGIPPYIVDQRGKTNSQILAEYRMLHEQAPRPALPGHMPMAQHLNRVIERCMQPDMHQRPASFAELRQALQWIYQQHTGTSFTSFQAVEKPLSPTNLCMRAMNQRFLGNYEQAMADVNQAIELEPSPFFYNERGILYTVLQQHDLALADYATAIERSAGKLADPFINRTVALRGLGRYEDALADYTSALAIDPDDFDAYRGRGSIYVEMENYEAALADLHRSLELAPRQVTTHYGLGLAYFGMGRYQEALQHYQQAIDIDRTYTDAHINYAMTHAALYDYTPQAVAEAVARLEQVNTVQPDDPAVYRSAGMLYYKIHDMEQALVFLEQAAQRGDEDAPQLIALVRHHIEHGTSPADFDAAPAAGTRAPTRVEVELAQKHVEKGNNLLAEQRYDQAREKFLDAIWVDPTAPDAFVKLGALYANEGQFYKALVMFEAAAQRGHAQAADNAAWIKQELAQPEHAEQARRSYSAASPPSHEAVLAFERGELHVATGSADDALAEHTKAIELAPDFAQAWNKRGVLYRRLERYQDALDDLNQALQREPRTALHYIERGNIYRAVKKDNAALADYQQAIRLAPRSVDAYFARSNLHFRRGKYRQAIKDDEQAIKLEPHNPTGYFNRAMCYKSMQKYKQALPDFTRSIELGQDDTDVYRNRGDVYIELNRYHDARADYEVLVEKDPTNATALCNLGFIYSNLSMTPWALTAFNRAIEASPNYAWAWYQRGRFFAEERQFEDALHDLLRAIELAPKFPQAYRFIGHVYREMSVYGHALDYYEAAARLGDDVGANEANLLRRHMR
jgi:tetratricopeptide (TPR) repeat protein